MEKEQLRDNYVDDRHRWLHIKQQNGGMSDSEWVEWRAFERKTADTESE